MLSYILLTIFNFLITTLYIENTKGMRKNKINFRYHVRTKLKYFMLMSTKCVFV